MKKLSINRLLLAILSCGALVACDGIGNAPENTQSSVSGVANNEATTLATSITESDPAVQDKYKIVGKIVNHEPCVGNLSMGCGFESGHGTQEQPYQAYPLKLYHVDVVYTNDSRNSVMQFKTHITPNTGNWSRTTWGCQNKTLNPSQSCTDTYSMMDNTPGDHNLLPLERLSVTWYSVDGRTYSERVFESPIYVTINTDRKDPRADRKIMFVTNGTYPTNMNEQGHHKGGDAICNTEALKLGEQNPHFWAVNEHPYGAFDYHTEYYRKDRLTKIFTTSRDNHYYDVYHNPIESIENRKPDFSNYVDYDGRPILAYYYNSGCEDWSNRIEVKNPDYYKTKHEGYDPLINSDKEYITEKVQKYGAKYEYRNAFSDDWQNSNRLEIHRNILSLFFETPNTLGLGRYTLAENYIYYHKNYGSSVQQGLCHDDAEATGQNHPERYNLHLLCVQQ